MWKARIRERLDLLALVAFGVVIFLVAMPQLLLTQNADDIREVSTYFRYFLLLSVPVLGLLAGAVFLLPRRVATLLASIVAASAFSVLLFDIVSPLRIGPIQEGNERIAAAWTPGVLQLLLTAALIPIFYLAPSRLRGTLAGVFVAVFAFTSLPMAFANQAGASHLAKAAPTEEKAAGGKPNVYHLVFDAYTGPWLEWSLAQLGRSTNDLSGFIHYRRACSNNYATTPSYASFMSGTMFDPSLAVTDWYDRADKSTIVTDLHGKGFVSSGYAIKSRNGIGQIQNLYTDDPGGRQAADFRLLADYWLLRVSPVALRHRVLGPTGAGPVTAAFSDPGDTPSGDIRTLMSFRQFEKFIADEKDRPATGQYVHVYVNVPHGPYQLDRTGRYISQSSYEEQLHLATSMMLRFVERLKELGRFEQSVIIVHSDHGSAQAASGRLVGDSQRYFIQIDPKTSKAIAKVDVRGSTGDKLEARYAALLLVKPCGRGDDGQPFQTNEALVQLLDLRRFVSEMVQDGSCRATYPVSSEVNIHHGLVTQQRPDGTRMTVGRDLMAGRINHYLIRPGGKWEIKDDIPFKYEGSRGTRSGGKVAMDD